ncbi:hypothetical protein PYW08_007204 [Mythimna loreyi]|uniref:Uncharacterized protein n=1 Tax=Mythimna loreyi TaxID=667449 RepID=A0ACC2RB72_9NEOP|nr:hypothetical protein PYW08_007204 [Mythimna loreyi]
MQWLLVTSLVVLMQYNVCKETPTYQVSGIQLVDLLRGFQPKEGMLSLTKVTGDPSSLPDGIYFKPEDEGLTGDSKYLTYKAQEKKGNFGQKTGVSHER